MYTREGALQLAHRLGFTVRTPRPVPYNTPSKKESEEHVAKTTKAISEHTQKGHKLFCIDSVGFANSPMASRGLMRVGSKETVGINYSKKTLKVIGALGADELHIRFQDKANSENAIALLKELAKCMANCS